MAYEAVFKSKENGKNDIEGFDNLQMMLLLNHVYILAKICHV